MRSLTSFEWVIMFLVVVICLNLTFFRFILLGTRRKRYYKWKEAGAAGVSEAGPVFTRLFIT